MYYAYTITNTINDGIYIGITKNVDARWRAHKWRAIKDKTNAHLYNAMNKHGIENFIITTIAYFTDVNDCCLFEISKIKYLRELGANLYNMHDGGTIGYDMSKSDKVAEWKANLSKARGDRKPALGMKHTDENKKLFSEVSNNYWKTQETYDYEAINSLSFKDANAKYGVSRTHYSRIRRRLATNVS